MNSVCGFAGDRPSSSAAARTAKWQQERREKGRAGIRSETVASTGCIISQRSWCRLRTDTRLTSAEPLPQRNNLKWWLLLHLPSLPLCLSSWACATLLTLSLPPSPRSPLPFIESPPTQADTRPHTWTADCSGCDFHMSAPIPPQPSAHPEPLSEQDRRLSYTLPTFRCSSSLELERKFSFGSFVIIGPYETKCRHKFAEVWVGIISYATHGFCQLTERGK